MTVRKVECRTALSVSKLPGLDLALNPYRGCSHGCLYCYVQDVTRFALDKPWGSVVEAKVNIASRLKAELAKGAHGVVGVGTVTDPYQPAESELELTRGCLALLRRHDARVSVLTKSDLVLRDLDLYRGWGSAEVGISLACVDESVSSLLEPGASTPKRRLMALKELGDEGVDVYLMAAPVIPSMSGSEEALRALVGSAGDHGVCRIMWDPFNPKPLASRRLASGAGQHSGQAVLAPSADWRLRARSVLAEACEEAGIRLLDAF